MSSPYDPILTKVGLLEPGPKGTKLTDNARAHYVAEVIALLASGNADGKGGVDAFTKIFTALVPLPPTAGPDVFNLTTLKNEKLFWFDPDPAATLLSVGLLDKSITPMWHKIFPDLLYVETAKALDVNGTTPFSPIFDVSAAFPDITLPLPYTPPDLALKLKLDPGKLLIKLGELGIKVPPDIPSFALGLPQVPTLPTLDISYPFLVLPDLLLKLIKLPIDLVVGLVVPPKIDLALNLPGLPKAAINLAIDLLLKILNIPVVLPKVLIASLLIWLKDVVAMACTVVVGLLVGAGSMSKLMATMTGLV